MTSKSPSERTPQVQTCSLLNNTLCWKEGGVFSDKVSVIFYTCLFYSLQWNFIKSSAAKALAHSLRFNATLELLEYGHDFYSCLALFL